MKMKLLLSCLPFPGLPSASLCIAMIFWFLGLHENLVAQNVGIGVSNPTRAKLEVHGAVGSTSAIFGGESTGISFQRNAAAIGFNQYYNSGGKYMSNGFAAVQYLDPANGNFIFDMFPSGTANASIASQYRALVIANNGNIGIKTNPTNATLAVIKAGNFDGSAIFGGTSYSSFFHYSGTEDTYIRPGKTGSTVFINDIPNGKVIFGSGTSQVGINSADPVYPLEIRQTGLRGMALVEPAETYNNWEQVVGFYNAGPHSSLKMIYNGQMKCFFRPTDGELINTSDRRLKTNIRPVPSILGKIMELRPVEYEMKYNNPNKEKTVGFIAQELKQVFPEMVFISPNSVVKDINIPDFHVINYNPLKIFAVKAVQEEQKIIDELQEQQSEIQKRLEVIEKKLAVRK